MTSMKWVFGALVCVLLMTSVFAGDIFGDSNLKESQVVVTPGNENGTLLNITVITFEPAVSTSGTNIREEMQKIVKECSVKPDVQKCINEEGLARTAASKDYQLNLQTVPDANITVEYYNVVGGGYTTVPNCEDLSAGNLATTYTQGSTGPVAVNTYFALCDITDTVKGQRRTTFRVIYRPGDADIRSSFTEYTFNNANVDASSAFTKTLNDIIRSVSEGGGAGTFTGAGSTLPCVGVFLIVGLLLSSLYFAGKSPITLLDITTPRLPAPKGVTAGGQILAPFGYGDLQRTTTAKMNAAAKAIGATTALYSSRMSGDAEYNHLRGKIQALKGTAEEKQVAEGIVAAGRQLGMRGKELEHLAKLPYHYGDAEHKTVAEILSKLEAKGGREKHMALQTRDYLLGDRTSKTLAVLSGHPDVALKSPTYAKISKVMDMGFGSNRYAILGTTIGAARGSLFRSGRVAGRMAKSIVTQTPNLARSLTKTTMEMVGGKASLDRLRYKGRTSTAAAWVHKQVTEHPSRIVVGTAFPVNEKMKYHYDTLRDHAIRDAQGRYVLEQFYKKLGLNFNVDGKKLASMGHIDMDILRESGFSQLSPAQLKELHLFEEKMRAILSNSELTLTQKYAQLAEMAQKDHGVELSQKMFALVARIDAIERSGEPDHIKYLMLNQELEAQNERRMSALNGGMVPEHEYFCFTGGDSLRGTEEWRQLVLRTTLWDAEHGHLSGGIKEELISGRLNVANRMGGLDPSHPGALEQLPEHARNQAELEAVARRNKEEFISLFEDHTKELFRKHTGKTMQASSIREIVEFTYGGTMPRSGHVDPKTKQMIYWECDQELKLPKGSAKVDIQRHWQTSLDPRENFAILQWSESRATKSYVPVHRASIEAELNRDPDSKSWNMEQRTVKMKELLAKEELHKDMEQRFDSHFGFNTTSTRHETMRFNVGIMNGFLEKAMEEKGLSSNDPSLTFVKGMDYHKPKDLGKLIGILKEHDAAYHEVASRPFTYDMVAKGDRASVLLHEGGMAYYTKGMMLGDKDRIMGGEPAIRDHNGVAHKFIAEDVAVKFGDRPDLKQEYDKCRRSNNPHDWDNLVNALGDWRQQGTPGTEERFNRDKVHAAVLWQYANTTYDYSRFWKQGAVEVEAKRMTAPSAPMFLRYFGVDGHKIGPGIKPFRDMGLHFMDYVSQVALLSGGPMHKTSYDVTPITEYYRQHSMQMAKTVMSGEGMDKLSDAERVAYRNAAMEHYAYHMVWDYAIDRNPWKSSSSFGTYQAWQAGFHFGPAANFSVKDNLGAYLKRGEYANFMGLYGFPMDLAGKMLRPYTNMIRGMQMSMMGYACKWDQTGDVLKQWNYTEPRLREALQSVNPFSFRWFSGKTSERMAKLNVYGGSLEQHQLAGPDFQAGLRQAPQDLFLQKKGVYSTLRTGAVNPGASAYDYRMEMHFDAPMAEYLYRTKEAAFLYDKRVYQSAMANTTRRTVAAEALALRRDQELRGFGAMMNPLYGWTSPAAFLFHVPVPLWPPGMTPRDQIANMVGKAKYGHGESFSDKLRHVSESLARGTERFFQPGILSRTIYCPVCRKPHARGSACTSFGCGTPLY